LLFLSLSRVNNRLRETLWENGNSTQHPTHGLNEGDNMGIPLPWCAGLDH
jgi:hypothetical protein